MKLSRLAMVGVAGAAVAYFFDPNSGHRRRRMAVDRAGAMLRRGTRAARRSSDQAAERAFGAGRDPVADLVPTGYDDATLSEKVYTYLNADPRFNGKVNVSAQYGEVVLVGEVEDPDEVVARVREIEGVGPIKSLLHRPGTPAPHMA